MNQPGGDESAGPRPEDVAQALRDGVAPSALLGSDTDTDTDSDTGVAPVAAAPPERT